MPDKRIADTIGYCVPSGTILYQNTGFQGFTLADINIIQPKKKPKGRELTSQCAITAHVRVMKLNLKTKRFSHI